MENSQKSLSETIVQKPQLGVKNRWIYYGAVIDRFFFEFLGATCFYTLSIFMDTISNKNNFNFYKTEREYYIGIFTTSFYIGSAVGSLLTGFLTRIDTRIVFAVLC